MSGWLRPLFTWRSAVASRHSGLPPVARHVALTLSLHMSEKGDSAFPGDELLMEETGLSRSTIKTHRHTLEIQGWLALVERGGGRGRANHYQATIPPWFEEIASPITRGRQKTGFVVAPSGETGQMTTLNRPDDDAKPVGSRPPGRKESDMEDVEPNLEMKGRRPRQRDQLFDAVVDQLQLDPAELTDSARGSLNFVCAQLRGVKATPEQVAVRCQRYRAKYPQAALTPTALAKHWAALGDAAGQGRVLPEKSGNAHRNEDVFRQARTEMGLDPDGGIHASQPSGRKPAQVIDIREANR